MKTSWHKNKTLFSIFKSLYFNIKNAMINIIH